MKKRNCSWIGYCLILTMAIGSIFAFIGCDAGSSSALDIGNKTDLEAAITAAETKNDSVLLTGTDEASVLKDEPFVTEEAKTRLTNAINAAIAVLEKATPTKAEVDAAIKELGDASAAFDAVKKVGTKDSGFTRAELTALIADANAAKEGVKTSADGEDVVISEQWVTSTVAAALNTAITAASSVTSTTIDTAYMNLYQAWKAYTAAKKFGKKEGNPTDNTEYTITISSTITNGTVTASTTKAKAGTTIQVTTKADTGYILKANSLVYTASKTGKDTRISSKKFDMPADDVTINAKFDPSASGGGGGGDGEDEDDEIVFVGEPGEDGIPVFYYDKFLEQLDRWRDELQPIIDAMTMDEKAGQMTQGEYEHVKPNINASGAVVTGNDVSTYFLGSVLSGGHTGPRGTGGSPAEWVAYTNLLRADSMNTRLRIPVIYGQDDMHGASKIKNATMLPHNVGLGALALGEFVASGGTITLSSNNTGIAEVNSLTGTATTGAILTGGNWNKARNMLYKDGLITGSEMRAAGILYSFSPVLGVPYDVRWGRAYECFSENVNVVKAVAPALMRGVFDGGAAPSSKHFGPEGQLANGASKGNANISVDEYRPIAAPYKAAFEAGVMCIMVAYGSRNGVKIHQDKALLQDLLKDEFGFQGMIISDWDSISEVSGATYQAKLGNSINAGIDMVMAANGVDNWKNTITGLKALVAAGTVTQERIDDAVMRILLFKKAIPYFWNAYGHDGTADTGISDEDISPTLTAGNIRTDANIKLPNGEVEANLDVAADLVSKTLVLLKNTKTEGESSTVIEKLKDAKNILLFGTGADDVGLACGGWTVSWQGSAGATTAGVTLRNALTSLGKIVTYRASNSTDTTGNFDAVIAVIAEDCYAEGTGDKSNNVVERSDDTNVLSRATTAANNANAPLILIIYSGRPLHLTTRVDGTKPEAVVAAWWPGSEAGTGIVDVLFGDKDFQGKTAFTWKRTYNGTDILYPFGHGLKKSEVNTN